MIINAFFFWLLLSVLFYIAYMLGARMSAMRLAEERAGAPSIEPDKLAAIEAKLSPFMDIIGRKAVGNVVEFEGHLKGESEQTYQELREQFKGDPVTPLLLEGDESDVRAVVVPGNRAEPSATRPRWWLHWLLFFATFATTTWAGALTTGVNLLQHPDQFAVGLPYSVGLLLILGAHELGHYFTAKAHGIQVTPPYFIPAPFALGTFGAFIKIQSLTPNRRALFDVAVAGPLAGLVFAIPALLIGLRLSAVVPGFAPPDIFGDGVRVDSSLLLALLTRLSLGVPVSEGHRLLLHPLAFAGWLGLIVTALNLLPIGQLDGGHIAHAMFGRRRAHALSVVAMVCLFLLALFVWPGLMYWAFIVFFIAGTDDAPAADDVTPVDFPRRLLGYFAFLLFLVIILPVPHSLYQGMGVHGPYL